MVRLQGSEKASVFDRLKRVTSQKFIPEIDGLRFLAIMPVLLMHFTTAYLDYSPNYDAAVINKTHWLRQVLLTGTLGVYIFFAISGFILALPFARYYLRGGNEISLTKYFKRRIVRLEPPYIITLTIFLFVHLIIVNQGTFGELLNHFTASLFYVHNLVFGEWSTINPVAWSLEIEVQFYLLVPLITKIFLLGKRLRRTTLLTLMALAPLIHILLPLREWHLNMSILSHYQYFLAGFLLADFYITEDIRPGKFFDLLGLILLVTIFVIELEGGLLSFTLPFAILLLFTTVLFGSKLKTVFSNPWLTTIGGMCYITYLIHYPLMHFITRVSTKYALGDNFTLDIMLQLLVFIPVVLMVSAVAFVLIEKPFMRLNTDNRREKLRALALDEQR